MTTAVHFDLDGTLVQFTRPYGTFVAAALTEHLGEAPDELVEAYDEAFYERFTAFDPAPVRGAMRVVLDRARETGILDGDANADADPADRHVMVGDDYEPDIQGARDAGWDAVHLDGQSGTRAGSVADFDGALSLVDPE